MPPDEPGAPSPGPRDTGSMATFRSGAEPAERGDAPEARDEATAGPPAPASPGPGEPRKAAPTRRRFLDDPDPDQPKAPRAPKVRARKVHRVVRHIEPWSVLK